MTRDDFNPGVRQDESVPPNACAGAVAGSKQLPPGRLADGVSVVVPVYNGHATLEELVERLLKVLPGCTAHYEIVLINDGSADSSWSTISDLARRHDCVVGISLMRNYGQHNALLCGVRAARFDKIVTMDDDLQHPPEEIPKLLDALGDNCDVVYGCPVELSHSLGRNLASWITKSVISRAIGSRQFKVLSAFRAFRTHLRHAFSDFQGPQLSFDLLLSWGANVIVSAEVVHQPRRAGKSNYNLLKLIDHTLILLTSYSTIPLRVATILGFLVTTLGLLILFYVIIRYLTAGSLPGFPFLASTITIFGGAQMLILGVIGEYLSRMYYRSLDKPTYVVLDQCMKTTE